MLNRRSLALAALSLPLARFSEAQTTKPLVIFLGNDQCSFCKIWESQSEPTFKSSPAFGRLDFRTIHPATFEAMLEEKNWPEDLRWVLTDFLMSDEGAQRAMWTPRFFLIEDKKIAVTVTGSDAWKTKMLPAIMVATGPKA